MRERLRLAYGAPACRRRRDPVDQLVRSLLGASGEPAAEAAFHVLHARFTPWTRLADARADEVASALGALAAGARRDGPDRHGPARRLIEALRALRRQVGRLTLGHLAAWPVEEAAAWLEALPGVDAQVAASVLALSTLNRAVPVPDAPLRRLAHRLALTEHDDARACRHAVADAAPQDWSGDDFAEFSELVRRLGEDVCRPARPACPGCPIVQLCAHGARFAPDARSPASAPARSAACPSALAAPPANENRPAGDRMDAYLRGRIARLERLGVAQTVADGVGVSLRREIDAAFLDNRLPAGAHQSAGVALEDGAAALVPALAAVATLPGRPLRVLLVQEADARREHGELHGPGLEVFGLKPHEAAFVRARDGPQALEVADEALRRGVAPAVLLELRRGAALADLSVTRRLNLQARRAGLFLFLVTPDLAATSGASTRWRVSAHASVAPRRRVGPPTFRLDLVRNRSGRTGSWIVEWSAHERRFLSARPVPLAGDGAPAVPAPVAAAAAHRSGAA